MKNITYRSPFFSFYDHTAIQKHLESMAAKGWMLEKPGNFIWRYRRVEPKRLHIAVTYFPDASDFDPGPTEGQQIMEEYAARDGWQLVARWGQMQIFYHEAETPVPIETDAVTQVNTIHRAMRKGMLRTQMIAAVVAAAQLILACWRFRMDPIDFLSTPSSLYLALVWILLLLEALFELWFYFYWYRKAKIVAEEDGVLFPIRTHRAGSIGMLAVAGLIIVLAFSSSKIGRFSALMGVAIVGGTMLITNVAKKSMKKAKISRGVNRTVSVGLAFVLSMVFMAGMAAIIIRCDVWDERGNAVGSYEIYGHTFKIYDDPMPLTVEDLTGAEGLWSKERQQDETFLLSRSEYRQDALPNQQNDVEDLQYTVVDIKVPALYEYCKNAWLSSYQDEVIPDSDYVFTDSYHPVDPAPWKAKEVYQHHWSDTVLNEYMVCWEGRIVEIQFFWEPTMEQIALTAQVLGK